MTAAMRRRMGILVGATLLLSACAAYGPTTISRDRFDYTAAISDSWKHQMLFNMVKIRYGDAPVFMDVSSVISQYQIAGLINLGATINSNPWSNSETLGATGQYVDRPTITFTPILGDKFARSLMAPIPPPAILSLMQAGYPVDLVFRMLVQEINGIRNRFGGEARARSADPEFYLLLEKMRKIQSGRGRRDASETKRQGRSRLAGFPGEAGSGDGGFVPGGPEDARFRPSDQRDQRGVWGHSQRRQRDRAPDAVAPGGSHRSVRGHRGPCRPCARAAGKPDSRGTGGCG